MNRSISPQDISFCHYVFNENGNFDVENINRNSIIFIINGIVAITSKNDPFHTAKSYFSGDLLFSPISYNFGLRFKTDGEILVISFESTLVIFKEMQKLLIVNRDEELIDYTGSLRVKYPLNMYLMLLLSYIKDGMMSPNLAYSKLSELFSLLKYYYNSRQVRSLFLPIVSNTPDFKIMVMSRMKIEYNVDQLAYACGMGKRTFEKKFKLAFNGEPPFSWIQKQKEEKILKRMSQAGVTISEIIQEFNFYDSSHFNKFCRKRFGKTPDEMMKY